MEAEVVRDVALATASLLDCEVGGPSVVESEPRRSLYLKHKRDRFPESLVLFDSPSSVASCSRRRTSTVALQPLYLLNSKAMQATAAAFARRIRDENPESEWAGQVLRTALGRSLHSNEEERAQRYLREHSLESLCLAVLNLTEFLYIQ